MIKKIKITKSWNKPIYRDIIDVRSPSEFDEDHIPGAINLRNSLVRAVTAEEVKELINKMINNLKSGNTY